MAPHITEWIHKFELGEGARWMRAGVGLLACLAAAMLYVVFEYQNLKDPAAMDAAQVARQVARGEGFTTQFIRPLSVQLLERHAEASGLALDDPARLATPHPDLANPPFYPLLLAGWLKILGTNPTIGQPGGSAVQGPDRSVVIFNLGLFLVLVIVTYAFGRHLFDGFVGLLASLALVGSAFFWREAGSGNSAVLGTLLTTLLAWGFLRFDEAAREESPRPMRLLVLAALLGGLTGLAALTCYGLLLLALPLGLLLLPTWGGRRWSAWLAALAALLIVVTPWLVRNYQLSGKLFGTAALTALNVDATEFPGDTLERSLEAQATLPALSQVSRKALPRLAEVLQRDLPTVGGSWVAAFFLVGLLFRFASPTRNVLRGFTLLALVALLPVHILAGPDPSEKSVFSGTPYLAMLAPLIFVLGSAFFATLLDQVDWEWEGIRSVVVGLFVLAALAPLVLMLLPPGRNPRTFPPYHPPMIHAFHGWTQPDELLMSDIPWAVAWYADRKAIWLPRHADEPGGREDFYAVHSPHRNIVGLYLTQVTTDSRFAAEMLEPRDARLRLRAQAEKHGLTSSATHTAESIGWPEFVLWTLGERRTLAGFPLLSAFADCASYGHLLLMDRARWLGAGPLPEGRESGIGIQPSPGTGNEGTKNP
jgi:hypothetical protein